MQFVQEILKTARQERIAVSRHERTKAETIMFVASGTNSTEFKIGRAYRIGDSDSDSDLDSLFTMFYNKESVSMYMYIFMVKRQSSVTPSFNKQDEKSNEELLGVCSVPFSSVRSAVRRWCCSRRAFLHSPVRRAFPTFG